MRELWERLREGLRENPKFVKNAAHALIVLVLYLIIKNLFRVITNIDLRRELGERRIRVE
jgi:hypothetical protein